MPSNKKILVIDDEPHIRRIIEMKLRKSGYEVVSAGDGEEGLRMIEAQEPDAVITDLNMPKLDGRAICDRIGDMRRDRPLLTIVITARLRSDEEAWMNGREDIIFMEKPFSPSRLLDCIDHHFALPG